MPTSTPPYVPYRTGPRGPKGDTGPPGPPGNDAVMPQELMDFLLTAGTVVRTFAEWQTAVALGARKITFAADIMLEDDMVIPDRCYTMVHPFHLVQDATPHTVQWSGYLPPIRDQIFVGFTAGQIKGPFGNGTAIPEWWGLIGIGEDDGEHDLAINAAIQSNLDGIFSINVSLGAFRYWIKRPLDLRGSKSRLLGVSEAITQIWSQRNFMPDSWLWSDIFTKILPNMQAPFTAIADEGDGKIRVTTDPGGCTEYYAGQEAVITGASAAVYNGTWVVDSVVDHENVILVKEWEGVTSTGAIAPVTLDGQMETGADSATALILIGSDTLGGGKSAFTGVSGISINGSYAVENNPTKRVHAIAWTGWVEEHSFIRHVNIYGFSGFAIGGEEVSGVTTVNGLDVSNFHIGKATRRASIGLYAPQHANCLRFYNGTVNLGVERADSRAAIGGPPDYVCEISQFGCYASGGHTEFEQVHVEGVYNAFFVQATGGGCAVSIKNCDHNNLMDWGMRWNGDEENRKVGVPDLAIQEAEDNLGTRQTFLFHTSCGIALGRTAISFAAAYNYDSRLIVENYNNSGIGIYLIRDWIYRVDFTTFGGRFPYAQGKQGCFYVRGIPVGEPWQSRITAAESHSAGAKTKLTVADSTGLAPGNQISISPDTAAGAGYATFWVVDSVPSGTEVVIDKAWTADVTGMLWRTGAEYDRNSPPTDKTYFIGPVW